MKNYDIVLMIWEPLSKEHMEEMMKIIDGIVDEIQLKVKQDWESIKKKPVLTTDTYFELDGRYFNAFFALDVEKVRFATKIVKEITEQEMNAGIANDLLDSSKDSKFKTIGGH